LRNWLVAAGAGNEKDIGKVAARAEFQPASDYYFGLELKNLRSLARGRFAAMQSWRSLDFITEN